MATGVLVGFMTAPDQATAEKIVDALVQERLIACGNIANGVQSLYRWQGAVERADEILVILKTTEPAAAAVVARVRDLHPYEVPEVLFFPVTIGYPPYMQWVRDSVSQ
jgi:periplasmic divalent cation tolerance protein